MRPKYEHSGGDTFDRHFIAMQTASLQETLDLAEAYARIGDDFDLKEFTAVTVPKLKTQLDRIREIECRHTVRLTSPVSVVTDKAIIQ